MRETRMDDYMDKLKELHPNVDEKVMRAIVKRGCTNVINNCRKDKDILIDSSRKGVKFLVYTYRSFKREKSIEKPTG